MIRGALPAAFISPAFDTRTECLLALVASQIASLGEIVSFKISKIKKAAERLLRQRAPRQVRSIVAIARQILRAAVQSYAGTGKPLGDLLVELSRPGVKLPRARDRTPHGPIDL